LLGQCAALNRGALVRLRVVARVSPPAPDIQSRIVKAQVFKARVSPPAPDIQSRIVKAHVFKARVGTPALQP